MPRPNRYHPYTRSSINMSSVTSAPVTSGALRSPRLPSPPRSCPKPMPWISEYPTSQTAPYEPIYPGYIRGITTDGKDLVAKSIVRCPDGMYHLQMEMVRYPSEVISAYMYSPVDTKLPVRPNPNTLKPTQGSLSQTDLQVDFQEYIAMRKDSCRSRHSDQSASTDCAILDSDDEDADGEDEDEEEEVQQPVTASPAGKKRVMIDMIIKRAAMQG
ncbi:hypothetical protein BDV96DRAFT_116762 [Lophiotrema nucula]|uniref:Uncharacterized protein n=1 Tax=Lophiotrema nucula TaxID=690887 RepID=A0A6A5Z4D0_9PLEO|nr:hypothetical protein BDV96DRAFT_116762 [Lophiotrema nucula]